MNNITLVFVFHMFQMNISYYNYARINYHAIACMKEITWSHVTKTRPSPSMGLLLDDYVMHFYKNWGQEMQRFCQLRLEPRPPSRDIICQNRVWQVNYCCPYKQALKQFIEGNGVWLETAQTLEAHPSERFQLQRTHLY